MNLPMILAGHSIEGLDGGIIVFICGTTDLIWFLHGVEPLPMELVVTA